MNFKVIFELDGTGIYYDPHEPIHLDALLAWALAPMQAPERCLMRSDTPDDIQLPLLRSTMHGAKVWHASALFPEQDGVETLRFWRKKFDQSRLHLTQGSPNLQNGVYREYNMPVPLLLVPRMIAYASGNRKAVKRLLKKHITALGKKRAYGYGRIVDITCEATADDWSVTADGVAMRWLPHPDGGRQVRPAPPYWNTVGAVACLEVGQRNTEAKRREDI
jgi:CRISPR type IV-associated protein Csf3